MPRPSRRPRGPLSRAMRRAPARGKCRAFTPRERLELVKNENYWDKARIPEGRQDAAAADAGGKCPNRGTALRPGRLDRSAGAGCGRGNQAARLYHLCERGAACLAVAVLAGRRLALERHSRSQGRQSLRRSRRPEGRLARRPDGAGDRHLRARSSLARQADLRDQVRQAGRAEADAGSRLWSEQEIDGQGPDLGVGIGPDAAVADERVSAAGVGRMLFRRSSSTSSNGIRCSPTGARAPRIRRQWVPTPPT